MPADNKTREFSDEARLKRFLELLPEQWMEDYRYVASDGRYDGEYENILKEYSYYANTIASHFLNKEIEEAYCKMNDSFFEMRKFMLPIFQIYKMDDNDSSLYRIGILPELRKSDLPEDNNRFINIFYKFFEYFDKFEEDYKKFLTVAFKEISHSPQKAEFYISKEGDDFFYNKRNLNLTKKSNYYVVFCALYDLLPHGGKIKYQDLILELKKRFKYRFKDISNEDMIDFIQGNISEKTNGFKRRAGLPEKEDNGKPLIDIERGIGIIFNNKKG